MNDIMYTEVKYKEIKYKNATKNNTKNNINGDINIIVNDDITDNIKNNAKDNIKNDVIDNIKMNTEQIQKIEHKENQKKNKINETNPNIEWIDWRIQKYVSKNVSKTVKESDPLIELKIELKMDPKIEPKMDPVIEPKMNHPKILKEKKLSITLDTDYKMLSQIGAGSFGSVWRIMDKKSLIEYAVKIEEKSSKTRLKYEYNIYKKLMNNGVYDGIPKIKKYFETSKNCYLIMELLGDSLDKILDETPLLFDHGFVMYLGIKIIGLLQKIHDVGYLHRDIKPNNFLTNGKNDMYIMDFGLSKKYINDQGEHIKMRTGCSLVGTARYSSVHIHNGFEPSRRDDLESVGYMLIYLVKKRLPWQGLKKKGEDQIRVIGECKMRTPLNELCSGLPCCFEMYIDYCRKLNFEETPNYDYLKQLFVDCAKMSKINLKLSKFV